MAVVLVKTFNLKPTGADVNFPDVPSNHWGLQLCQNFSTK